MINATELKVGDRVAFSGAYDHQYGYSTVESITKTTIKLADSKVFNKEGRQLRVGDHRGLRLMAAADLDQKRAADEARRSYNRQVNDLKNRVEAIARGHSNGYGDVSRFSDEEKAELIAMVSAL